MLLEIYERFNKEFFAKLRYYVFSTLAGYQLCTEINMWVDPGVVSLISEDHSPVTMEEMYTTWTDEVAVY